MSKLFESYGFLTGKIVQLIEEDFIEKLKSFDIDARQYGMLVKVFESPNMSQIQIAEELKIDRTTMAERAEQLESLNYITRVKNPQDKRTYCLNITKQGIELVESYWKLLKQSESKILSPLSDEEKEIFKNYLLKIYNTWKGNTNE
ncbi:MarR family winged helix-turn-helix transcriptional regulator [Rummeliibacillus pycnus]|uniref:MarR family winged helix-turn-helix transcriptional regulator n=1 Tax=Rummeliibacillus pycnus TaxID=101070 RepID=UPI000C9C9D92|nr:MarR family transcriptional regulator [Rummeliibacillus pycnus]